MTPETTVDQALAAVREIVTRLDPPPPDLAPRLAEIAEDVELQRHLDAQSGGGW